MLMMDADSSTSPAGDVAEHVTLRAADQTALQVRFYKPAAMVPRGKVLVIVHGGGEHGGRYGHVAEFWRQRGWLVIIPDLRGHGLSDGPRTDVSTFDRYLDDLEHVRQRCVPADAHEVWLGHSLGGLLAARWVQRTNRPPQRLLLSSPLLGLLLPVPWWKKLLGHCLLWVAPQTRFRTGIRVANLTRDPEVIAQRRADPLIQRSVTARWFFALQKSLTQVWDDVSQIRCPVFIVQGDADRTTDPVAARRWSKRLIHVDSEFMEIPQGLHELLNDQGWERIADRLEQWSRP
jgi:lysophospholipase